MKNLGFLSQVNWVTSFGDTFFPYKTFQEFRWTYFFFSLFTLQIWNIEYLGIFLSDIFLFVCPHLVFPVTLNLKYTLGLVITNTFTSTPSLEQLNGLNFPLIQMQKMNFYFEGVSVTCCTPSPPTSRRLCTPGTQLILSTSSKNTIPDKNKCKRLKSIEWQWQNADI